MGRPSYNGYYGPYQADWDDDDDELRRYAASLRRQDRKSSLQKHLEALGSKPKDEEDEDKDRKRLSW